MRPPLEISPIHAEFYSVQFHGWDGAVACLLSGDPANDLRKAEIELVLGYSVVLTLVPLERIRERGRERFGEGASAYGITELVQPAGRISFCDRR